MGFLNHATNNIIIDAVLTERGREKLALNDGTFRVSAFSFGDDEVDYSIIKKYGLSIGKEKIIKNTPIYEANPNENIALKHQCISFPNPLTKIDKMPTIIWENAGARTSITLFDTSNSNTTPINAEIVVSTSIEGVDLDFRLDQNISDSQFIVKMNNDLLTVANEPFVDKDTNNIATYLFQTATKSQDSTNKLFANQKTRTFTITTSGVVNSNDFTRFATIGDSNKIITKIQIIGQSSGASKIIPVEINRNVSV